jgi:DNA repair protein RadC
MSPSKTKLNSQKNFGHRKHLRDRFLQSGLEGFLDYEIVELLLTLNTPRKDCKPIAKEVIKKFKGLRGAIHASAEELQEVDGIGPKNIFGLRLFQAISERYAKEQLPERISLNSSKVVAIYLQKSIGLKKKEHFVALYLDARNNLIKISNISIGTLNASLVHSREVFREAIQSSASGVIIAHNHPTENPEASPEDVALTRRLEEAAKIIGIELVDHIIVTKDKHFSMKEKGLM